MPAAVLWCTLHLVLMPTTVTASCLLVMCRPLPIIFLAALVGTMKCTWAGQKHRTCITALFHVQSKQLVLRHLQPPTHHPWLCLSLPTASRGSATLRSTRRQDAQLAHKPALGPGSPLTWSKLRLPAVGSMPSDFIFFGRSEGSR